MTTENWKPIPGFLGYDVSDHGRVRSYHARGGTITWCISDTPQRILKPGKQTNGYPYTSLQHGGKGHIWYIHRLVLLAFVGPRPDGLECCHNDGNPANNHLSNLRYDTHLANCTDAHRHHGKWPTSKLDDRDVIKMRNMRAAGALCADLAKLFHIGSYTALCICAGRNYKMVGGPLTLASDFRVSDETVRCIRQERRDTESSLSELAKTYSVDHSAISLIARGKRRLSAGGPIEGVDYQRD